ncbi:MAG: PAS domain-containing protein [Candidatus Komeilibacteria bacterium]
MKDSQSPSKDDKELALYYIKTFSDTAREPLLILDTNLKIVGANKAFYRTFLVSPEETENKLIYDIGNGQWNIPKLKALLEKILPDTKTFDDFEVEHEFPTIGLKIMLLNARQFDSSQLILLAIEDITVKRAVEIKLANYTKDLEKGVAAKTEELKARVDELSKLNSVMVGRELKMSSMKLEIEDLKKQQSA